MAKAPAKRTVKKPKKIGKVPLKVVKAAVKKVAAKRKASKAKTSTTSKAKKAPAKRKAKTFVKKEFDLVMGMPVFLRRTIKGKIPVTHYETHGDLLVKCGDDGNYYDADTDKKVKKPKR